MSARCGSGARRETARGAEPVDEAQPEPEAEPEPRSRPVAVAEGGESRMSATISASLVKELRDGTGAGMMDCKRALEETGGDLEAARTLLRERGMASAGKRAGRETTEGLVGYIVDGGRGSIVGIGCETEPVSKSDEFQDFAEKVLRAVHADGRGAVEAFEEERIELIGKLGENIVVVGCRPASRSSTGTSSEGYAHPPANKIGVLVDLEGGTRGARTAARDAHLLRGARVDDTRGRSGRGVSRASARSSSTPTRCSRSRRPRVRRSWTACSTSASSRRLRAVRSSSRRGSTIRPRRSAGR